MVRSELELARPDEVAIGGWLGNAANASARGRLRTFIVDARSAPLALFEPEFRDAHTAGDWHGEHAGKWLVAASRAARRLGDEVLFERVRWVGRFLKQHQEPSGAISTYAPDAACRYADPRSESVRTWDVWIQACLILGLLEAHRLHPDEGFLDVAYRIGVGLERVFGPGERNLRDSGNHAGLSSTIALEPIAALALATDDPAMRAFAQKIVEEIADSASLDLVGVCSRGEDLAGVGTGKAYQILWNLIGLVRYFELSRDGSVLRAVQGGWRDVANNHLTLGGGPWGGVARHKECFTPAGFFSPYGLVETCSTWTWIRLSSDLYRLTGEPLYVESAERAAYNHLLGAMDPNGEDWSYYTMPNGARHRTYDMACCKSSGACALEELAPLAFSVSGSEYRIGMIGPARLRRDGVSIEVRGDFPESGTIELRASGLPRGAALMLRSPAWADSVDLCYAGKPSMASPKSGWIRVEPAGPDVELSMNLRFGPRVHAAESRIEHYGKEVSRIDYAGVTLGPLCMATGLVDGYRKIETLRLPRSGAEKLFEQVDSSPGEGPALALSREGASDILYRPYARVGSEAPGSWRAAWHEVDWQ